MPVPTLRGTSTATGTTTVTINVPAGTAEGDGLTLALLRDLCGGFTTSLSGWTTMGTVSGEMFNVYQRIWHAGDPTSVTWTPSAVPLHPSGPAASTNIAALMYCFQNSALSSNIGSIPSGGSNTAKIECPGGTGDVYLAFGAIDDNASPQLTSLTGDSPLTGVVNVSNGRIWLVGGYDTANTSSNRLFSGVTLPDLSGGWRSRMGIGARLAYALAPPTGGWGVGQIRMGA